MLHAPPRSTNLCDRAAIFIPAGNGAENFKPSMPAAQSPAELDVIIYVQVRDVVTAFARELGDIAAEFEEGE